MFPRSTLVSGLLLALVPLTSFGQTFSLDQNAPAAPNTYRNNGTFGVGTPFGGQNVQFNNTTGSGSDPYSIAPDFKQTVVTLGDGSEVEVFDVCAEIFVGPTGSSTYSVSEGFGPLTAAQEDATRALFSNAIDEFIVARDTLTSDPDVVGAAIQIAFWEIVEDTGLSLDEGSVLANDLSVLGFAGGYSGPTADAIALAETYLTNVREGTWTDQGGYNFYYADAGSEQNRLWITTGVIPEPSTALLGLLGGLLLLRRRR